MITWKCPACESGLKRNDGQWRCDKGHCYDVAREGYVNLLLANRKSSNEPGDNSLMINARRNFLESDHYLPLVAEINRLILKFSESASLKIHDAGCGEGYYLQRLQNSLQDQYESVQASGSDISKIAIRRAAKKYPAIEFAVASNFELPVANGSVDVLLHIFAPTSVEEVLRVLPATGLWIRVSPGSGHLQQIKSLIYQTPEKHVADEVVPAGMTELETSKLSFELVLEEKSSRQQLLEMTPYYWHMEKDKLHDTIAEMAVISVDFNIRCLRRES